MKKLNMYQIFCISILAMFILFVIGSYKNYKDLLDVSNSYEKLLEKQRDDSHKVIKNWKNSYEDLQKDYARCLTERNQFEEQLKTVNLPVYNLTQSDVYLLAKCAEAEAGETNYMAQRYIVQVVLNRIASGKFPASVDEVIYQKVNGVPQFSVAYDGRIDREVNPSTLINVYEAIVQGTDLPSYVCYFYSNYVKENWVNTLNTYTVTQGTVFAYESKEE